ncbi:PASTA domain-containing protein [Mesorhizobium muleiense]|uniref:PASTA domain-containing protein n=1 Tax=Mesorhizobium muleiense TaxID=1004279 RepID=UPI001F21D249|nr:PASTA domain-containing protein [Mesorhizobium muleiense]MCF6110344.1 PASTA domain-containing protein [Mesorhizobium muleiense]
MFRVMSLLSIGIVSSAGLANIALAESVPSLLGMQISEAEAAAGKSGVSLVVQKVDSLERRGKIILQVPEIGSEIGTGRQIFVRVSDGMPVPDLTGKSKADAEAALTKVGIGHEASDRRHDGLVRNTVAAQVPKPGSRVDASSEVVFLDIVGGRYVTVPDIAGQRLSDAMETLRKGELTPVEDPADKDLAATSRRSVRKDCTGINTITANAIKSEPQAGTEVYSGISVKVIYENTTTFTADDTCEPIPAKDICENPGAC